MGVLPDFMISEYFHKNIVPFSSRNVQPSSYDLTLDSDITDIRGNSVGDDRIFAVDDRPGPGEEFDVLTEFFKIFPGEFFLARTREHITMPNFLCGMVTGRSTYGRLGLMVHCEAGLVDPSFSGTITFELKLLGPEEVNIPIGGRIGQISFLRMETTPILPYGHKALGSHYQGQLQTTPSYLATGNLGLPEKEGRIDGWGCSVGYDPSR